jgi:membrane protease YdiL (CAAX protease family)
MKPRTPLAVFLTFIILLVVFLLNMTLVPKIPAHYLLFTRVMLIAFFGAGIVLFKIKKMDNARRLSFTLMTITLAFLIVSFFTTSFWGIDLETPKGIAYAKLSDSVVICLVLIVSFLIGGYKLKDIYLAKGKLGAGLLVGLLTFFLMGLLAIYNPDQPIEKDFLLENLHWMLIFVLSNAFLEELLFRGILLKQLGKYMKHVWAIVLTSVVFAAAHLQVTYTSDVLFLVGVVLVLGLIWGFIMHYTRSILASVLFHAGADLMIIIPIYSNFGVQG